MIVERTGNRCRPGEGDVGRARSGGRSRRNVRYRDGARRAERRRRRNVIETARPEIAILQADIDVRAHREADACDALVSPGAIAQTERLHASAADTATGVETAAAANVKIQQGIDHTRPDIDVIAEVEGRQASRRVGKRRGGQRTRRRKARRDGGSEGGGLTKVLYVCLLVAKLAFEAEHAEVISGDRIDVVARLKASLGGSDGGRGKSRESSRQRADRARTGCSCGRTGSRRLSRLRERRRVGAVHVLREEDAPFETDISGAVGCQSRCRDHQCGAREQNIAHHQQ